MKPLLNVPETAWRLAQADRLRVLVDGEEYFSAVRSALLKARRSIWILGWDINSRLHLVRPDPGDGHPAELKALLVSILKAHPDLHVYLLTWDYSWIYAREREFLPTEMKCWACHPRLHFAMDSRHQLGASHHQKIVIVDEALAFCGGFDLTSHRWDRRSHEPVDPLRRNTDRGRYAPFHDVQMMVSGPVVQALSELACERWTNATGDKSARLRDKPGGEKVAPLWLEEFSPEMENVQVGISRTLSAYQDCQAVDEIERLYRASIQAAKNYIYLENQYFTSEAIARELIASLEKEQGPEVVLVISENSSGWLEEMTMDVLRSRWFERLREADRHHRFKIYHPLHGKTAITVHGKVMITDDRLLRVGSANLSNRSMSFDSECDLSVDAALNSGVEEAIRARCLDFCSEHLDTPAETLGAYWAECGSLIQTIERFRGRNRTLVPVDEDLPLWMDGLVEGMVGQSERPQRSRWLMRHLKSLQVYRWRMLAAVGVSALCVTVWLVSPLKDVFGLPALLKAIKEFGSVPNAPVWLLVLFVAFSFCAVPIWIPAFLTLLMFPLEEACVLAWLGCLTAATVDYWAARLFGRKLLRGYLGYDLKLLSRKLGAGGFWTIAQLRMMPYSSFTLVNLVSGALVLRFPKYLLATGLGLVPLIGGVALVKDTLAFWVESVSAPAVIAAVGVATLGVALFRLYRRENGSLVFSSIRVKR